MPRFIPIVIEVQDGKATPRVKGLKNALDDLTKSESKAARGFTNVFDSTAKVSTQNLQKLDSSIKQIGHTALKTASETKGAFKQIESQADTTAKSSSSSFSQFFGAAFFAGFVLVASGFAVPEPMRLVLFGLGGALGGLSWLALPVFPLLLATHVFKERR